MPATPLTLVTTLEARGPAAAIVLTDEEVAELGGGPKVFPVRVTVDGYTFAGRLARMGGENLIGLNKAVREAAGVAAGQEVQVHLELDASERTVVVPEDLAAVLDADPAVRGAFDALSHTRRKELVRWVEEAKRPETRQRRLDDVPGRVLGG